MNRICGIYAIHNTKTGEMYVGSSKNIPARIDWHIRDLEQHIHHSKRLQAAWNKYGKDAFVAYILEQCGSRILLRREQKWIDKLKPSYNMLKTTHPSKALIRKIRRAHGRKSLVGHANTRNS